MCLLPANSLADTASQGYPGNFDQITAASLIGYYGHAIQDFSLKLLRHRKAHFVATDAHNPGGRAPMLSKARDLTEAIIGPEEANRIFYEYAVQVLRGEAPDVMPAIFFEKKTPLIRRSFPFR
jgi:protein-tyrosine phosphatase